MSFLLPSANHKPAPSSHTPSDDPSDITSDTHTAAKKILDALTHGTDLKFEDAAPGVLRLEAPPGGVPITELVEVLKNGFDAVGVNGLIPKSLYKPDSSGTCDVRLMALEIDGLPHLPPVVDPLQLQDGLVLYLKLNKQNQVTDSADPSRDIQCKGGGSFTGDERFSTCYKFTDRDSYINIQRVFAWRSRLPKATSIQSGGGVDLRILGQAGKNQTIRHAGVRRRMVVPGRGRPSRSARQVPIWPALCRLGYSTRQGEVGPRHGDLRWRGEG